METTRTSQEMTGAASATFAGRVVTALQVIASLILLTITSVVMFLVGLLTAFRLRRFYTEVIAAWLGRALLRIWGVRFRLHAPGPFRESETIYISNHPSTLDMFILIGMGLPNTRYFMSSYLRYILPLGLIGFTMGIFFAPLQRYPERRVECFRNATRVLRTTRECVFLSPEGRRRPDGLGPFNKGAFHLATELGFPIVPLYIDVPADVSPGVKLVARPGTVDVFVKPAIPTHDWELDDLDQNRAMVRNLFLQWEAEARPENRATGGAPGTAP